MHSQEQLRFPYSEQIDKNSSDLIAVMIKYIDDTTQLLKNLVRITYFSVYGISICIS